MKTAVMYGAGNIGRGFLGQLFSLSGYETVFIDVNRELTGALERDGRYPLYIAEGEGYTRSVVEHVRAVDGRDSAAVAEAIAACELMATAVGVNAMRFIAEPLAAGIELRAAEGAAPLNIIICENMLDADKYLRSLVAERLSAPAAEYFANRVGLAEASIGRMVPATPAAIAQIEPTAVCAESYGELPVDADALVGGVPSLVGLQPSRPFELFIRRKLFMHNASHALTAYLGSLEGCEFIWQAIAVPRIRSAASELLAEAASALARAYGADESALLAFGDDLLRRYANRLLADPVARVGRDTARKLGPSDRLAGGLSFAASEGVDTRAFALGIAAGLRFAPPDDASSAAVAAFAASNGVPEALERYCGITEPSAVSLISELYNTI